MVIKFDSVDSDKYRKKKKRRSEEAKKRRNKEEEKKRRREEEKRRRDGKDKKRATARLVASLRSVIGANENVFVLLTGVIGGKPVFIR
jgi:hypothetical protein